MSKAGEKLLRAAKQARDIARGAADPSTYRVHVPEHVDVKAIRAGLDMTQPAFSAAFGISLSTLRKWEQEGRTPEGPTRAYLKVIERDPEAVMLALAEAGAVPKEHLAKAAAARRARRAAG